MPSKIAFFVLLLTLLCYIGATTLEVPGLLYMSAVSIALLAVSWVWWAITCFGLDADLEVDARAFRGDKARVCATIRNSLPFPKFGVPLEFTFPPAADKEKIVRLWFARIAAGRESTAGNERICNYRGRHKIGQVTIRHTDPLGLFVRRQTLNTDAEIEVRPSWIPIKHFPFMEAGPGYHAVRNTSPKPGQATEFYALRPYVQGDSPRWIHWLSTARKQELMTRQFQTPLRKRILLLLDCRAGLRRFLGQSTSFENAVTVATSFVFYAYDTGHDIAFSAPGTELPGIQPASATDNASHILSQLAVVRRGTKHSLSTVYNNFATQAHALVAVLPAQSGYLSESLQEIADFGTNQFVVITSDPGEDRTEAERKYGRELRYAGVTGSVVTGIDHLQRELEKPL